jgi:hypothetical protein
VKEKAENTAGLMNKYLYIFSFLLAIFKQQSLPVSSLSSGVRYGISYDTLNKK